MVVDLTDGTGLAEAKMPKKRSKSAKKEVGAYASALFTLCALVLASLHSCLVYSLAVNLQQSYNSGFRVEG